MKKYLVLREKAVKTLITIKTSQIIAVVASRASNTHCYYFTESMRRQVCRNVT